MKRRPRCRACGRPIGGGRLGFASHYKSKHPVLYKLSPRARRLVLDGEAGSIGRQRLLTWYGVVG